MKTTVFGVRHGMEYVDEALEAIIPTISEPAVIGLEVEPESVALFEKLNVTGEHEGSLESEVLRHHGLHSGTVQEDYQGARMILFHYRMHRALRERGCTVFGFETSQRLRYPRKPFTEQHSDLQRLSFSFIHGDETTLGFQLMVGPWFNRYAANAVRYHHATHAVVGSVHAPIVSRLIDGDCVLLAMPPPDVLEDSILLEELYRRLSEYLPSPAYSVDSR